MKTTLLALVAVGLSGGMAFAGGLEPAPEPYIEHVYMDPPVVEASWEGFYGGVLGGRISGEVDDVPTTSLDGTTYGAFAGYNFQRDQFVFGAEIAAQIGTMDLESALTRDRSVDLDYLVDVKARVGYSFGDALIFASGGYSTMKSDDAPFEASGWNVGAGLDYAITEQFFVGGEYVYRDLSFDVPAGFNATAHAGQVRLGIKF